MTQPTETTIAMVLTAIGIVGTLGRYALAWYGIRKVQEVRDAYDRPSE